VHKSCIVGGGHARSYVWPWTSKLVIFMPEAIQPIRVLCSNHLLFLYLFGHVVLFVLSKYFDELHLTLAAFGHKFDFAANFRETSILVYMI
jgi:hypothetical protein